MISPLRAVSAGREAVVMLLTAAAIIALPWFLELIGGYRDLATMILIWGLFALGFDILLGFTGFLSFGHAAFWGVSAYATGFYLLHVGDTVLPAMLMAVVISTVLALALGYLTLRRHGIYFAILTLAFAEMLYFLGLSPLKGITGGENGLTGIPTPVLLGSLDLTGEVMYWFTAVVVFIGVYVARRIVRSPHGLMFRAIKSNETRLAFTGVNTWKYKMMAFAISGIYGGVAGSLFTVHQTYVGVNSLHWTTSGEVVMMSVIGGVGTLFGPMLGAGILLYLENVLSAALAEWELVLGLIFMGFVIFLPGGLVEGLRRLYNLVFGRRGEAHGEAAAPAGEQAD